MRIGRLTVRWYVEPTPQLAIHWNHIPPPTYRYAERHYVMLGWLFLWRRSLWIGWRDKSHQRTDMFTCVWCGIMADIAPPDGSLEHSVCPDCCVKHLDGHEWTYCRDERQTVCEYCGTPDLDSDPYDHFIP